MGPTLEGEEGEELDAGGGGGGRWSKTTRGGEGSKVCRVIYYERFVFTIFRLLGKSASLKESHDPSQSGIRFDTVPSDNRIKPVQTCSYLFNHKDPIVQILSLQ